MSKLYISICPNCYYVIATTQQCYTRELCDCCYTRMKRATLAEVRKVLVKNYDKLLRSYISQLEPGFLERIFSYAHLDTYEGINRISDKLYFWALRSKEQREEFAKMLGFKLD